MSQCTPEPLRFSPVAGLTVRADFQGGALSSDVGVMLLRGIDPQIGLSQPLAQAVDDRRHPSYTDHPLVALFAQRTYQIACGYADANDANTLRSDPLFKLGLDRKPLDPATDWASAPTFARLENAATPRDIYRLARTFGAQFIASYPQAPELIVLAMDHTEDIPHGQQELSFYNAPYGHHCYLPLFVFAGLSGKFVTAALRPGKRPAGAENARILKRVLKCLRAAWPDTVIVLRGDSHFANPELMQLALADPLVEFIFGLSTTVVLARLARPFLDATRRQHERHGENAPRCQRTLPAHTRTYHELDYAAASWPQPFRVVLKAEVMALGEKPR